MKQIKIILSIAIIAMIGVFTACEEGEDAQDPTLNFFNSEYIVDDVTVEAGSTLRWHWQAEKGDNNLEKFEVFKDASPIKTYDDIDKDTFKDSLVIDAPLNEGKYGYDFVITDNNGNTAEKEFIVTVEKSANPIKSFTAILMGAQQNTEHGSALDAYNNNVYFISGDEDKKCR